MALVTWIIMAGGAYLLAGRLAGETPRERAGAGRLSPGLAGVPVLLLAAGLVVWIIYLFVPRPVLAWVALVLLATGAVGGLAMLARRVDVLGAPYAAMIAPTAGGGTTEPEIATVGPPPGRRLPPAVLATHGLLTAVTLVLVLLTALGAGAR